MQVARAKEDIKQVTKNGDGDTNGFTHKSTINCYCPESKVTIKSTKIVVKRVVNRMSMLDL